MREYKLHYDKPATDWYAALPIGSGRLGAMLYGVPEREHIQLNEETMWSGFRDDNADNPDCPEKISEIRRLLFAGKNKKAGELTQKYMVCRGDGSASGHGYKHPYGSYQTAGDLYISVKSGDGEIRDYRRELRLNDGCATTTYIAGGTAFTRRAFSSPSANVTVFQFTADTPSTVEYKLVFERENSHVSYDENQIVCSGILDDGIPEYTAKAQRYATVVGIENSMGSIETDGQNALIITASDPVTLYITTATTYSDKSDPLNRAEIIIHEAMAVGYDELYRRNAEFFTEMLGKSEINVAANRSSEEKTTDERLAAVKEGKADDALYELHWMYGKYLLLCSSYNCVLPANLQGVWSNLYNEVWSADYHININLQMNYWLANLTGLSELEDVHFRYIKMLSERGRTTAQTQYNAGGWVAHTITNPWGFTSPGEGASWGSFMCAGAWECGHIWQRYLFTRDTEFLREYYPVLRGAAEFFFDFLCEDPRTGCLVTAPSNSPENSYIDENGDRCSVCAGPTMDNTILYELFTNVAETEKILGIKDGIGSEALEKRDKLPPIRTGSQGQILEWQKEYEEPEPGHRHLSPLYGLHPASVITKSGTPELFDGAKKLIERRLSSGGGHTGWSRAWIINFKARLGQGNSAYSDITALLAKSTLTNLFDTHPPFQIDGNFGYTSGVCEMLLGSQQTDGDGCVILELLPALPDAWQTGSFKGLYGRGNVSVDCEWRDGRVVSFTLRSPLDEKFTVWVNGGAMTVKTKVNETITTTIQ